MILVLYVDDILLTTNYLSLLCETNKFIFNNFEIKDMGEAMIDNLSVHQDQQHRD